MRYVAAFLLCAMPAYAHDVHPIEISAMHRNSSGGVTIVIHDTAPGQSIRCALYDKDEKAFAVRSVISSTLATKVPFYERLPEDWSGARCVYE